MVHFYFLTDLQTYPNIPIRGTRVELPMYDGAVIKRILIIWLVVDQQKKELLNIQMGFIS